MAGQTPGPGAAGPTLHHVRFDPTEVRGAFRVTVADGPDRGLTLRIDGTLPLPTLIGQSEACHLRLADPTVSRRHASLEVIDAGLLLRDLDSTNGTRAAGVRVREAVIEQAATVELGATVLRIEREVTDASPALSSAAGFGRVLGASTEMRRLYPLCERLAQTALPVVIEGETGTGKEALAEALHEQGPRRDQPFVVFDCTAVPGNLMEAELFGHERGAFTGADRAREGLFALAEGGTLFIDEIGDLEPTLQPKLLRAIDRSEVRPLGGARAQKVDVRIIAATRRDLDREVQAGRFRDDLFHRLAVGRIELPPLRRRRGDVALLARHFWRELGGDPQALSASLLQRWESEPWPGNVRELRNTVARVLALGELSAHGQTVRPAGDGLEDGAWLEALVALPLGEARSRVVARFEELYVRKLLERKGGNVTRAAEHAGVARRYFHLLKARVQQRDPGET
jgi:DNA-binding NtrC family response regulator